MNYKVIKPVVMEPLTINEVYSYPRLTGVDRTEELLLKGLITAAREYCEQITRRALATQTIEVYLDHFPCGDRFELPRPPLQSVISVKYTDSGGTENMMAPGTDYLVDGGSNAGKIVLPYGRSWPSFTPYSVNPIVVTYVAGYDAYNPIPRSIKLAMLLLIGHWYENREAVGNVGGRIEYGVQSLLMTQKSGWF